MIPRAILLISVVSINEVFIKVFNRKLQFTRVTRIFKAASLLELHLVMGSLD